MRNVTLIALLLAVTGNAAAQGTDSYPSKSVRMVVTAAAPGGNPDVLARLLGQKLSEAFGKPFIIENMPGAGGVPAAVSVAKAPARYKLPPSLLLQPFLNPPLRQWRE